MADGCVLLVACGLPRSLCCIRTIFLRFSSVLSFFDGGSARLGRLISRGLRRGRLRSRCFPWLRLCRLLRRLTLTRLGRLGLSGGLWSLCLFLSRLRGRLRCRIGARRFALSRLGALCLRSFRLVAGRSVRRNISLGIIAGLRRGSPRSLLSLGRSRDRLVNGFLGLLLGS